MENERSEAIESLKEYITNFKVAVSDAAELFQGYEINKATTLLAEITEGTHWMLNTLVLINVINKDDVEQININLNEIVKGLENQDYILVGDLLQYEIIPKVELIEDKLIGLYN